MYYDILYIHHVLQNAFNFFWYNLYKYSLGITQQIRHSSSSLNISKCKYNFFIGWLRFIRRVPQVVHLMLNMFRDTLKYTKMHMVLRLKRESCNTGPFLSTALIFIIFICNDPKSTSEW